MSDATTPPREAHASGSHYQPPLSVVLIIVVLFVGSTFLMVRAASSSSSSSTTTTTTTTTVPSKPVVKSKVRVQVLNGTNFSGLAGDYTQRLTTQDWDALPAGNAHATASTIIYYNPGYERAAQLVADIVHVSQSVVHPLGNLVPVAGAKTDDVIVVLGRNSRLK